MRSHASPKSSRFPWALFWLMVGLALWAPVQWAEWQRDNSQGQWWNLFATAGWLLVLWVMARRAQGRLSRTLWSGVLLGSIFLRVLHAGLVHFSGQGFTVDVFLHLEWRSMHLALAQYGLAIAVLFVCLGLLAVVALRVLRLGRVGPQRGAMMAVVTGLALMLLARGGLPEYQLLRAAQVWFTPLQTELAPEVRQRWQTASWLQLDLLPKEKVKARASDAPKNLILLYLESGGRALFDLPQWPDLMPNLRALQQQYGLATDLHASAFITIEGIANSQCGTLLPFQHDSDSMADGDKVFARMTCLGDVLQRADYQNVWLGGAEMGFAGKGAFLQAHGYSELYGLRHWQAQGLPVDEQNWGLSDVDLLSQAEREWERLHASGQPFNLSLLTLGMHLPGFRYPECVPYAGSDAQFLQAAHCTDQLVGAWVERLRQHGVFTDTVLVITADHHVFPNPEMRELFGAAVEDRRLPLIIIGEESLPTSVSATAAQVDLAPTLLQMLGIEHSAPFLLGRSVWAAGLADRYLPTRYRDVFRGREVDAAADCVAATTPPSLPLDVCDKRELMQVLNATVGALQQAAPRLSCDLESPALQWRAVPDSSAELFLDDRPQRAHFTRDARPLREWQAGMYALDFDPNGVLRQRHYLPAELPSDDPRWNALQEDSPRRLWLWWPGEQALPEQHPLRRAWQQRWHDAPTQSPWLAIDRSEFTHPLDDSWSLSPEECHQLLGT